MKTLNSKNYSAKFLSNLEKDFFFSHSLQEVQKMLGIDLSTEELIEWRREIHNILQTKTNCKQESCSLLGGHLTLKRDSDSNLSLQKIKCQKPKEFLNFAPNLINQRISKLLIGNIQLSQEWILSLNWKGNTNVQKFASPIKSSYNLTQTNKSKRMTEEQLIKLLAYNCVIRDETVMCLSGEELKKSLCGKGYFEHHDDLPVERVDNVIIHSFGLENDGYKCAYFLSHFREFLNRFNSDLRGDKCKHIYILSPVSWKDLSKTIIENKDFKGSVINKHKMETLNSLMCSIFALSCH